MKQYFKTFLKVMIFIIVLIWILDKIPFNQDINQEIAVNIYKNGTVVDKTTVKIDGEKSNYLFTDEEQYWGKFQIISYEKTTIEGINAGIDWNSKDNMQSITYMMPGVFPDMDIIRIILINDEMTKFALMFNDGTVMATSDDLYELYTKHISINEAGDISINDVYGIPPIK